VAAKMQPGTEHELSGNQHFYDAGCGKKVAKSEKLSIGTVPIPEYIRKLFCLPEKIDKIAMPSSEWPLFRFCLSR
jgi:hypothetical protein